MLDITADLWQDRDGRDVQGLGLQGAAYLPVNCVNSILLQAHDGAECCALDCNTWTEEVETSWSGLTCAQWSKAEGPTKPARCTSKMYRSTHEFTVS